MACGRIFHAQVMLPHYPDTLFSTYYQQRLTHFKSLPLTKGDIIFLGNSITDGGEWSELFIDLRAKNRGISGDISAGVLNRLDEVAERSPAKVFLLIGINDLARNISPDSVVKNILWMASYLKQETPSTQIFVQSILPVSNVFGKFDGHTNKGKQIKQVNERLKQLAVKYAYVFIDLHPSFCDENGKLQKELTNDGLHLTGRGYLLWKHLVYPYVFGLQRRAALLPLPQKVQWKNGFFPLYACRSILIQDETIRKEGLWLQDELQGMGLHLLLDHQEQEKECNSIVLQLGPVETPLLKEEAYHLEVNQEKIVLTANTPHGIFNGLQTLLQLSRDRTMIDACIITDWPAFAWRGYMIDVGRNYQSMELLKQQIDVMTRYKLNVFHFHPTEDIAWRIAIRQYPELTAPENMLRNKGQFYSEEEIKELIGFCRQRYITFVPEIDMPGHSAAFRRALKTDMQSDTGLLIVKNILKEFCQTYDVPYIHIGADEVKIKNPDFIPQVTAFLQSRGKKVIGWQPGGNFVANTIRQLWMDDRGKITGNAHLQYIDSRHLYLNHMDPLESVVSIFNRQIGNRISGDNSALGGTLCLWHDRAVAKEEDVLRMNPVYPGLLAFAERSWRGGGQAGWVANISGGDAASFAEFENRLLDLKKSYFKNKPFPYNLQSNLSWQLLGPYANDGKLSKTFAPELSLSGSSKQNVYKQVTGGTIVLRHWWAPLIKGAIEQPKDSTTWYVATSIWSDKEEVNDFWIGFNNLSRSPATDSPPVDGWDNKGSSVWVNGKFIAPPQWKRAGQKGHSEIPLTDEGYEYREPTKIALKKGWNTVLIKAPVGSFKGKDWQNPVKWMFTFVPLYNE
jgi:lysophospholipase L1-like esterase